MNVLSRFACLLAFLTLLFACNESSTRTEAPKDPELFTLMSPDSTGIHFQNDLKEGLNTNVLMYEYFYNGAGVAVADLNDDGLQDIYFTSNMGESKLYLNKGDFKFEDITRSASVINRPGPWRTGVTIADINGDGKRDIFVSYSGKVRGSNRIPQLFINQGNDPSGKPMFTEQAASYGLNDSAFCTQGYFFDFDLDGDLDFFSLNHNPNNLPVLDEARTAALLKETSSEIGVRLYKNDNNHFDDITARSGISSSPLTYGLSASISDINEDGWPDIYIANDYNVPDYLYINNRNGTFTNHIEDYLGHTSKSSMGNNIADVNNDAHPDIFVLDMLPEDNRRQKLLFAPDNYEKFEVTLRSGFYYQYMRNVLQLNNGNGTFSEIGQLTGVSNTDWSWAPLLADYDNDGWKDLYVTNGYTRDYTNMDFLKYMNDYIKQKGRLKREEVLSILSNMPASDISNYCFRNQSDLRFQNVTASWGLQRPSNSNGAAYADLDNDGDLDLIVNNVNIPAFIYRNESRQQNNRHFLDLQLRGAGKNTDGIGAKVIIYQDSLQQMLEQMPARGFQSSNTPLLHFGLGSSSKIDSLRIIWPGRQTQLISPVPADQVLTLYQDSAKGRWSSPSAAPVYLEETRPAVNFAFKQEDVNDFKRQPLLINPLSYEGPCMAKADLDGDGIEDLFIGGALGQPAAIFRQNSAGSFQKINNPAFDEDAAAEDAAVTIADFNQDGFPDIYVGSGGYHELTEDDSRLQDRLYLNNGKGSFTKAANALPQMLSSTGAVAAADINGDGAPDLFVGGRTVPGKYPVIPRSYILINDKQGHFQEQTKTTAPALQNPGMITSALFNDFNGDGKPDLLIAGEWMPLRIFLNQNGKLEDHSTDFFEQEYSGWYNTVRLVDLNKDGKLDLVAGNYGLNGQCQVSNTEPADLYYKDFDGNGAIDPILCFYIQHKSYPYVTRDELLDQMSNMRTRFTSYKDYADASIQQVFTAEELKDAGHLQVNNLETVLFLRGSNGKFERKALPLQAQFSPVFSITPLDYNNDGNTDLLLAGNINHARLKFGKADASYGIILENDGAGNFSYVNQDRSGLKLKGDVRSIEQFGDKLLVGFNEKPVATYRIKKTIN